MLEFIRPFVLTFVQPANFLMVLAGIGLVLLWLGKWRAGRRCLTVTAALFLLFGLWSLPGKLLEVLEDRFAQVRENPSPIAGIIVLGGATDLSLTVARGQSQVNGAAERLLTFASLARDYPDAPLIFTGGGPETAGMREADVARRALTDLGLDPKRVLWERTSLTTAENAGNTLALVGAEAAAGPEPWLLITSARHMPRAMGTFRQAGWHVLAYPVDYQTAGPQDWLDFGTWPKLSGYGLALHEWLGLISYRLKGHTAEIFPSP